MTQNQSDCESWTYFVSKFTNGKNFLTNQIDDELKGLGFLYELNEISNKCQNWIDSLSIKDHADLKESNSLREEGNKYFTTNQFWKAIIYYTKAIYKTSDKVGSIEASKAHANRAAACYQIKFYETALFDCRCAIALGFPNSIVSELYFRLADCACKVHNIKQFEFAIKKLSEEVKHNRLSKMEEKEFNLLKRSFELLKNDSTEQKECQDEILAFENKQTILYSVDKGRYVIAKDDISKNEIIAIENAFAFIPIFGESSKTREDDGIFICYNCAKENIIPFPCYECQTTYCSLDCRNLHKSIHEYECIGLKRSLFQRIGIAYLAFRVFIKGFNLLIEDLIIECTNNKLYFDNLEDLWKKILEMAKEKSNNQYYEVISLIHHMDKIDKNDLLKYRLTAIMLTC